MVSRGVSATTRLCDFAYLAPLRETNATHETSGDLQGSAISVFAPAARGIKIIIGPVEVDQVMEYG